MNYYTNNKNLKKSQGKHARRVCFVIGLFGIFLLIPFNWNIFLVKDGLKLSAKVIHIEELKKEVSGGTTVEIEYNRLGNELVHRRIRDYTGENFLFFIEEGDLLTIYESKDKPYKCYVPFLHIVPKIFIGVFFILIPFVFAIFGR